MSPYHQIRVAYLAGDRPAGVSWEELVGYHLANDLFHLVKGPDFFVMGRAIVKGAPLEQIRDLTHRFEPSDCTAWHLWSFAGDMGKAWRALPYELPWLAWERLHEAENELRYVSSASIKRLSITHG
jgi:hypothetical protein